MNKLNIKEFIEFLEKENIPPMPELLQENIEKIFNLIQEANYNNLENIIEQVTNLYKDITDPFNNVLKLYLTSKEMLGQNSNNIKQENNEMFNVIVRIKDAGKYTAIGAIKALKNLLGLPLTDCKEKLKPLAEPKGIVVLKEKLSTQELTDYIDQNSIIFTEIGMELDKIKL